MEKTSLLKNKKALAALAVLAILLAAYFTKSKWLPFFQKKNDTPASGTTNNTGNTSTNNTNTNSTSTSTTIDKATILKRGDSGPSVKELQRLINTKLQPPLATLVEDGEFGPKTETALLSVFGANTASINQFNTKFPVIPSVFTMI